MQRTSNRGASFALVQRLPAAHGQRSIEKRLAYALRATAAPPAVQAAFVQRLEEHLGSPLPPHAPVEPMIPWLYRNFVKNPNGTFKDFTSVRDWWLSQRVDLGPMSYAQAVEAARAWHKELAKAAKKYESAVAARGTKVMDFPDGSAWYVVTIGEPNRRIRANLRAVGAALGHCYSKQGGQLGSYLSAYSLFTLYDKRGKPHVTAAQLGLPATNTAHERTAGQVKITGDAPPTPDCRWTPHIVALLEANWVAWGPDTWKIAPSRVLRRVLTEHLAALTRPRVRRIFGGFGGNAVPVLRAPAPDLLANPQIPADLFPALADAFLGSGSGLARNPNFPIALIEAVAAGDRWRNLTPDTRLILASHPNVSDTAIRRLAHGVEWVPANLARILSVPVCRVLLETADADIRHMLAVYGPPSCFHS